MGFLRLAILAASLDADVLEATYPPSDQPGELQLGVTYTLWLPEGAARIRGIIVHQHGCGSGACKGGATAAYDLHWRALAKKWDCALLGPSYHQDDKQNCRLWCDPRNGSDRTFLKAIAEFAARSNHPELETAPWCLWGHSGGGTWASLMQTLHPDRIVAIWLRSGTAFGAWDKGDLPKPEIPESAYAIPVMCNPGAKENGDKRFSGAWTGTLAMFKAYRARGAPIGFAPDPRTSHECGDSRYLAIPFFDACLAMRLPSEGSKLRPVDLKAAWLADPLGDAPSPAASYPGQADAAVWLPNETVAKAWSEYVKTGAVGDSTPPAPATGVQAALRSGGGVEITWQAEADFESGIKAFVVQRDGQNLAQVPEKPLGRFGRPLFQAMSYHDTPEKPLPAMRFVDSTAAPGEKHEYRVIVVNGVDRRSEPSKAASAPWRDREDILAVIAAQAEAWNRGDLDSFLKGYWKSEETVFAGGDKVHRGFDATAERYRAAYPTPEKMGRVTFSNLAFERLEGDRATVTGSWELELAGPEKRPGGLFEKRPGGVFTLLWRRFADGWKIIHDHTSSRP